MTTQDARELFEYTLGSKSHMNMAGKIIFSPIIVVAGVTWFLLDFLFAKR